jgi:tripartite-type tricarboxylate transporter receptor subunit TctC
MQAHWRIIMWNNITEETISMTLQFWRYLSAVAVASLLLSPASAQNYPVKTVRMIVPFPPGGNTDIIARIVVPKFSEDLGQSVVIDNRGGAGSIIGTEIASKSPPDGYTLLMVSAAHVMNPSVTKKLPYDSIKDFAPISVVADVPTALVAHPSLPVKNVKELVALAKARPGELNYATAGIGTVGHLAGELFNTMAGVKLVQILYKGSGPAGIDLLAGHVQLQFASMPAVIQFVRTGKMRMLAQTGEKRSAAAADVPTMIESGLKGYVVSSGFALFAPAGTPKPIIDRVHTSLIKALKTPDVSKNLAGQGAEPVGSTPEQHDAFNKVEIQKWIKVARQAGIEQK